MISFYHLCLLYLDMNCIMKCQLLSLSKNRFLILLSIIAQYWDIISTHLFCLISELTHFYEMIYMYVVHCAWKTIHNMSHQYPMIPMTIRQYIVSYLVISNLKF